MLRIYLASLTVFFSLIYSLSAQDMEYGKIPDTLYGEVSMELE
jgi:hypothetical protein